VTEEDKLCTLCPLPQIVSLYMTIFIVTPNCYTKASLVLALRHIAYATSNVVCVTVTVVDDTT